jgi:GNAT superfamily N-acetyltransferase
MHKQKIEIRNAAINDASDISCLSEQLGYPASEAFIKDQLNAVSNSDDNIAYVAVVPDGQISAWIHAHKSQSIQSGARAEISGFIVSEGFRGNGVGTKLLEAVEKWAIQNQLPKLRVRSNSEREGAKKFYTNKGFSISKQQRVFDKLL